MSGRRDTTLEPQQLRSLSSLGEIVMPGEAEEPILAPKVRAAMFAWLGEINGRDDLKAAGLKPRTTALLFGPPGCGKTTLAHHLAARLGLPMLLVGAENINGKYLGDNEAAMARLFDTVGKAERSVILFIDEMEAVAGRRISEGRGSDGGRNAGLTVMLRKMERSSAIVIGATNRPDDIDPAIWRRFGMQIDVALPDLDSRYAILKRYAAPFELDPELLEALANATEGAAPSLLRQIMEGLKRAVVLAPRLRRSVPDTARAAVAEIIASVAPPPEMEVPWLWHAGGLDSLDGFAWPPKKLDAQ